MPVTDQAWDMHISGVHALCRPADVWAGVRAVGDGTPRKCPLAGKVERFHAHDFDGPLVCGCADFRI